MKITKLTIVVLISVLIIGQASAADVLVTPASKTAAQGETFILNVSIDPSSVAIAGAQLNLAFNKSILNVNSITEGDLFKQNGANTFFNGGTINNSLGTVLSIYTAILGPYNVSTPGTFIIINATAIGSSGADGIHLSNVKISDPSGFLVSQTVTNGSITVNTPPVLASIGNTIIDEEQALTLTLSAADANGDTLTYAASNLPGGATFNSTSQTFQWTPDFTQSGTYPDVHFEVSDGTLTDFENITITVNNVNRAPTFTSTPANGSIFNETDPIQINITASDPDNDALNYTIEIDGIQVSTEASYTWNINGTDYPSSGYHSINISVSDGTAIVSNTVTVYINVYRYDVNKDGTVDIGDITIIGQHFGESTVAPYPRYDVNMDGAVDISDVVITGQHLGEST